VDPDSSVSGFAGWGGGAREPSAVAGYISHAQLLFEAGAREATPWDDELDLFSAFM
jgi:hypothetical protein